MFETGDLIVCFLPDEYRFVRRIVGVSGDKYLVSDPLFAYFGSTFVRWSKPKEVTKRYIEKKFALITDEKAIEGYNTIKKGQTTDLLPDLLTLIPI